MEQLPTLDAGVTVLEGDGARAALYRLVGRHLDENAGVAYWVDAGNAASPAAFREHASRHAQAHVRVARAFTGYQHYELVRDLPRRLRPAGTALVVAPNLPALYAEDDVPDYEADAMFDATRELLTAVARAVDAPVLVTADGSAYGEAVRAWADHVVEADRTRAGLRFEGASFRTDVYWDAWGFQTTIPYWVDLLGAVDATDVPGVVEPVAVEG